MAHGVFFPYAVMLDTTLIDGVTDHPIDVGADVARPVVDGLADPRICFVNTYNHTLGITSHAIVTALGAMTTAADPCSGKAIVGGTDTVTVYCIGAASGGTRSANTAVKILINAGLCVPVTINAPGESPATISLMMYATKYSTNAPFTITTSQSQAGTPSHDEVYFAGPAKLNNVAVDGIQSMTINFGVSVAVRREKGLADATFCYISNIQPSISIITDNVDLAATYQRGVAIASSTFVQLRQAAAGGDRVAEASVVHPQFTVAQGMIISRQISGAPQSMAVDIIPSYNGTNKQIAYAAAAIA